MWIGRLAAVLLAQSPDAGIPYRLNPGLEQVMQAVVVPVDAGLVSPADSGTDAGAETDGGTFPDAGSSSDAGSSAHRSDTAVLAVQPGVARPGDAVLITVRGAKKEPRGTLAHTELTFFPTPAGWQALVGLKVEEPEGSLAIKVTFVDESGERDLNGTLEVGPANFRRSELKVDRKFTHPSAKQKKRMAEDQAAFNAAFDQPDDSRRFTTNFAWPRPKVITAPFGDLRLFNGKKKSQHFGTDIDGDTGDPVLAANDGVVVMARDCYASGNTVLIFHGSNLFTAYFHFSRFDVKDGAKVKKGQQIGLVGKTGRVTGPHLHFGAKLQNRWVNTESVLSLDFE